MIYEFLLYRWSLIYQCEFFFDFYDNYIDDSNNSIIIHNDISLNKTKRITETIEYFIKNDSIDEKELTKYLKNKKTIIVYNYLNYIQNWELHFRKLLLNNPQKIVFIINNSNATIFENLNRNLSKINNNKKYNKDL